MAKRKKVSITCRYCIIFQESKKRKKETISNTILYERYCKFLSKYVSSKNKICENFAPSKVFWCDSRGYWVDIKVCNKNCIKSRGCKQLKIIKEICGVLGVARKKG